MRYLIGLFIIVMCASAADTNTPPRNLGSTNKVPRPLATTNSVGKLIHENSPKPGLYLTEPYRTKVIVPPEYANADKFIKSPGHSPVGKIIVPEVKLIPLK